MLLYSINLLSGKYLYKFEEILSGLHYFWELQQLDLENVICTQRNGEIYRFNLKTNELKLILKEEVLQWSEGGTLGIALHPDF